MDRLSTPDLLELAALLRKYSEDQARDDNGRFAGGGGGDIVSGWKDTQPWNRPAADFKDGKVPGVTYTADQGTHGAMGSIIAHADFVSGTISVGDKFLALPPQQQQATLYHEAGHLAVAGFDPQPYLTDRQTAGGWNVPWSQSGANLATGVTPGTSLSEIMADTWQGAVLYDELRSGTDISDDQRALATALLEHGGAKGFPTEAHFTPTFIGPMNDRQMTFTPKITKSNPYHEPAGSPEGGQFASADGGGGEFAPVDDPSKWAYDHYATYYDDMGPTQRDAVEAYSSVYYKEINGQLRSGEPLTGDIPGIVTNADQAIAGAPRVPGDMMVYRGVGSSATYERLQTGDRLTDSAYVSTSLEKAPAEGFVRPRDGGSGTLIQIQLPAGSSALYDPFHGLQEMILPRGSIFEVVDPWKSGQMTVRVVQ